MKEIEMEKSFKMKSQNKCHLREDSEIIGKPIKILIYKGGVAA